MRADVQGKLDVPFPPIHGGHRLEDVHADILRYAATTMRCISHHPMLTRRSLHDMAQTLRARRFATGSLRLHSQKLVRARSAMARNNAVL